MKLTQRFMVRAGLVLCAAGVVGAFGACKDNAGPTPPPPPPPPPPPAALPAPTNLTATPVSATRINLSWAETDTNETGFRIDRCSGAACTNFAQIGTGAVNAVAFVDTVGLAASTQYSYRVRAFNATDTSAWTAAVSATTLAAAAPSFTLVGAGEITSCTPGQSSQTALLIDGVISKNPDAIVFTAGNNLNDPVATSASYETCFDPTWGKFKPRMHVAMGQQDFATVNSTQAMYDYFGAAAGPDRNGWYSFNVGTDWHVIVLNTATWQHGVNNLTGDDPNQPKPQLDWLQADLAANTKPCIAVISWERRFYSGAGATYMNYNMRAITSMLVTAGADLLISAKDKMYERFAPQNHLGVADPNGIRQFIVGTGGRSLDNASGLQNPPTLEVRDASTHGVLKLTLNAGTYEWEFIPTIPGGFSDKSTAPVACH